MYILIIKNSAYIFFLNIAVFPYFFNLMFFFSRSYHGYKMQQIHARLVGFGVSQFEQR